MRRLLSGLLALVLAMSLTACGQPPLPEDGKIQVVCTLFPYYDFARQIGGDDVDVTLVVPAGRETHSFEPTPMDVIRISQADVFIYNGGESEQWVADILDAAGENIPCILSMMDAAELYEEAAEIADDLYTYYTALSGKAKLLLKSGRDEDALEALALYKKFLEDAEIETHAEILKNASLTPMWIMECADGAVKLLERLQPDNLEEIEYYSALSAEYLDAMLDYFDVDADDSDDE